MKNKLIPFFLDAGKKMEVESAVRYDKNTPQILDTAFRMVSPKRGLVFEAHLCEGWSDAYVQIRSGSQVLQKKFTLDDFNSFIQEMLLLDAIPTSFFNPLNFI